MNAPIRITTFDDLRVAFAARKAALRLRNLDVDEIAGLQSGYTGKLLAGMKRPGDMSLPAILGALGCVLILTPCNDTSHNPDSRDEIAVRLKRKLDDRAAKAWETRKLRTTADERRKWAKRAARARWRKAQPQGRAALAKRKVRKRRRVIAPGGA